MIRRDAVRPMAPLGVGEVQAQELDIPPPLRRGGYDVAGWDGARWVPQGTFDSGAEAAAKAQLVLAEQQGVRVSQDVFDEDEGVFKSRVIFTEYRDAAAPERPAAAPPAARPADPAPRRRAGLAPRAPADRTAVVIASAALAVAILTLILTLLR